MSWGLTAGNSSTYRDISLTCDDMGSETYTTVNQEALEPPYTFFYKSLKLARITWDDPTIETDVDPALALGSLDFDLQIFYCSRRRDGVEWHVNNGGYTSKGGSTSASPEAFPFRAPRLIEMYMSVYQTGEENVW